MDNATLKFAVELQDKIETIYRRLSLVKELYEEGPVNFERYTPASNPRQEKRIVIYESDLNKEEFDKIYELVKSKFEGEAEGLKKQLTDM